MIEQLEKNYRNMHDVLFRHDEGSAGNFSSWVRKKSEPIYPRLGRSSPEADEPGHSSTSAETEKGSKEEGNNGEGTKIGPPEPNNQ